MASLDEYAVLLAVVERGSLTAAAQQLGRSLQAVSRALAALEQELGVTLVHRTTRRSRPTEVGLRFSERVRAALSDLQLARLEVQEAQGQVAGRLRVAGPVNFGPAYLAPMVAAFMERYPAVEVELVLAERYADFLAEGIDLAVRLGAIPDSSLMSRRLGTLRQVMFAAPRYFAARGRPSVPADLRGHDCIIRTTAQSAESWVLSREGSTERIEVRGRFRSNSPAACNEAAALGLGIAMAPLWQVRALLDQGRVELVLTDHEPLPMPVQLVWPAGEALALRSRRFIDFVAGRIATERM